MYYIWVTVLVQFNSVRVFNRTIKDSSVRNTLWAVFFGVFGASYGIDAIRYATNIAHMGYDDPLSNVSISSMSGEGTVPPETIDAWMLMSSSFLRILSIFILTLALDYQLVHRSPGKVKEPRTLFLSAQGYRTRQFQAPQAPQPRSATATSRTPLRTALPRGPPSYGATNRGLSVQTNSASTSMTGAWPRTSSRTSYTPTSPPHLSSSSSSSSSSSAPSITRRSSRSFSNPTVVTAPDDDTDTAADVITAEVELHVDADASSPLTPVSPIVEKRGCLWCRRKADVESGDEEDTPCCFCWCFDGIVGVVYRVVTSRVFAYLSVLTLSSMSFYLLINPTLTDPRPFHKINIIPPALISSGRLPPTPIALRLHLLTSVLQRLPIILIAFKILISVPHATRRRSNSISAQQQPRAALRPDFSLVPSGPSVKSRIILLVTVILMLCLTLTEPSYVAIWVDAVWMKGAGSVCIVPPWWWLDAGGRGTGWSGTRGWASIVDALVWVGGLGICMAFWFLRIEFKRNMEEWIWATVSQVQDTFFSNRT
ncbi:hypothetical protein BC829DRAFT_129374 [Chytridium lagenaria]|nr:hypothetical protein BC829DRAFT_129374 [Chytridium lagenaria]